MLTVKNAMKYWVTKLKSIVPRRVLQGAAQRGGGNFASLLRFSGPFFSCIKVNLFYLKTCAPM